MDTETVRHGDRTQKEEGYDVFLLREQNEVDTVHLSDDSFAAYMAAVTHGEILGTARHYVVTYRDRSIRVSCETETAMRTELFLSLEEKRKLHEEMRTHRYLKGARDT